MANKKVSRSEDPNVYAFVQYGGSSHEAYLYTFCTRKQAENHVRSCNRASYLASRIFTVPRWLANQPGFLDCLQKLLDAVMVDCSW